MLQFRFLNFTSIPALFCVFFLFACSQNIKKGSEKENLVVVLDSLLNEHSFVRNSLDPNNLELLAGNSELGGLISATGLGFDSLWCSDMWANKEFRIPLEGVKLILDDVDFSAGQISAYSQKLSLKDGVVITNVQLDTGTSFETEVFFSAKSKRVLAMKIKNSSSQKVLQGKIRLPEAKFEYESSWPEYAIAKANDNHYKVSRISDFEITGVSPDTLFTQGAWSLKSDKQLKETSQSNQFGLELEPESSQTFFFSFVTKWQSEEFVKLSGEYVKNIGSFDEEKKQHIALWDADWAKTPLLILPEKEHEKLFYQSVYWLFCTSGSEQFLPGEAQFAGTCWNMKPFTYGAAGWATLAYMHLGHFDKAKKMLINHYKPEGLLENSKLYIKDEQKGKLAYSFAHEAQTDGTTTKTCDEQRHVNGFALALFHKYYVLTGEEEFLHEYLYPVAKGVAEFWTDLAEWDEDVNGYIFPKLRSVSEDLFEKSLLDIVLSAKWSLETAIHYGQKLNTDPELTARWTEVLNKIHIPQNNKYYLEFLNDNEARDYASYQGVRAPVYLGYPSSELMFTLDTTKAKNTLKHAWQRNHRGDGMLGFIASWYALSAQNYGMGDLAKEMAGQNFNCYDPSKTALCEGPHNLERSYFLTSSASYLLFPINMFVQSFENEIVSLPAVPTSWKNAEFYNIPASNGHTVSGMIKNGQTQWYKVEKENNIVHETVKRETIKLNSN